MGNFCSFWRVVSLIHLISNLLLEFAFVGSLDNGFYGTVSLDPKSSGPRIQVGVLCSLTTAYACGHNE